MSYKVSKTRKNSDKNRDLPNSKTKEVTEITKVLKEYSQKGFSEKEIISLLKQKKEFFPVSIFKLSDLSGLELIVKYLRENEGLSFKEIAELLNRNISTITSTHAKSVVKDSNKLVVSDFSILIPVSIIADRKFSVLESIVVYLKESERLEFSDIGRMLVKDRRTIWTVYSRAMEKRGHK